MGKCLLFSHSHTCSSTLMFASITQSVSEREREAELLAPCPSFSLIDSVLAWNVPVSCSKIRKSSSMTPVLLQCLLVCSVLSDRTEHYCENQNSNHLQQFLNTASRQRRKQERIWMLDGQSSGDHCHLPVLPVYCLELISAIYASQPQLRPNIQYAHTERMHTNTHTHTHTHVNSHEERKGNYMLVVPIMFLPPNHINRSIFSKRERSSSLTCQSIDRRNPNQLLNRGEGVPSFSSSGCLCLMIG